MQQPPGHRLRAGSWAGCSLLLAGCQIVTGPCERCTVELRLHRQIGVELDAPSAGVTLQAPAIPASGASAPDSLTRQEVP